MFERLRAIIKQNIIIIILEFNYYYYYKLEPSSSIMREGKPLGGEGGRGGRERGGGGRIRPNNSRLNVPTNVLTCPQRPLPIDKFRGDVRVAIPPFFWFTTAHTRSQRPQRCHSRVMKNPEK